MSKLVNDNHFGQTAHLMYTDDEKIGTFQVLQCDVHGNVLHFTDYSGTDNCIRCIELNLLDELANELAPIDDPYGILDEHDKFVKNLKGATK